MLLVPNKDLMQSRNIVGEHRKLLEDAYAKLNPLISNPEYYGDPDHVVEQVEALEHTIQYLWGFPFDRTFHRYWKEISGCICPKLDNRDPLYHGLRITDTTCKFHGTKENKSA